MNFFTANLAWLVIISFLNLIIVYLVIDRRKIIKLARYDGLTGLRNRNAFMDSIESLILFLPSLENERRNKKRISNIAIMMIDLDYFKQINDKYGHEVGDLSLKLTADVLRRSLRDADILCRWGGEEFLVALPDFAQAEQKAIAINKALSEVIVPNCPSVSLSASIGLVSIDVYTGVEIETFLYEYIKQADLAMYAAKNYGRNCVVVYDTDKYHKHKKMF